MRTTIAITSNIETYRLAIEALDQRARAIEGMALIHGEAGQGKTTATAYLVNRAQGVYVRANATWTVTSLLSSILVELGAPVMHRRQHMLDFIVQHLMDSQRPLFVDEADYLCRHIDLLDVIRDIYDYTRVPVALVGMERLPRRIATHARLSRRIMAEVKFEGLPLDDAQVVTDALCEVGVDADLTALLHMQSRGNIGLFVNGLATIEREAKRNGWETVSLTQWGNRSLFFGRAQSMRRRAPEGTGK